MSWPLAFAVLRTSGRSPGQAWWIGSAVVGRSAALVCGSSAARAMPGRRFTAGSDGERPASRASMGGRRRSALRGVRLGLCALIGGGRLQDVYFYMSAVAAVNVGLFYLVSVVDTAPAFRGGPRPAGGRVGGLGEAPAGGVEEPRPPPAP